MFSCFGACVVCVCAVCVCVSVCVLCVSVLKISVNNLIQTLHLWGYGDYMPNKPVLESVTAIKKISQCGYAPVIYCGELVRSVGQEIGDYVIITIQRNKGEEE